MVPIALFAQPNDDINAALLVALLGQSPFLNSDTGRNGR
jgi:hypothetical protein